MSAPRRVTAILIDPEAGISRAIKIDPNAEIADILGDSYVTAPIWLEDQDHDWNERAGDLHCDVSPTAADKVMEIDGMRFDAGWSRAQWGGGKSLIVSRTKDGRLKSVSMDVRSLPITIRELEIDEFEQAA